MFFEKSTPICGTVSVLWQTACRSRQKADTSAMVRTKWSSILPARVGVKYIWKPPINVTQALNIKLETKATKKLLKKADEQCLDDDCKKQVAECRKNLSTCVIVPAPGSVRESEVENN